MASLEAGPALNVLVGNNGAGKTTVLEALIVLAKGRSFRTGHTKALIGPCDDRFLVTAGIEDQHERTITLGIERSVSDWRARRDGQDVKQLSDLARDLPLVLMEPNSHLLISGPPDGRRRYLDWGVFHVEQQFLGTWRRYSRAVKQRNAALRAQDARMVQSLDPLLVDLGQQIHVLRSAHIMKLGEGLQTFLNTLGPGLPDITLRYQKGWSGDCLRTALEQASHRDLERGMTSPGPHRADLQFQTGGHAARDALSRGEQKLLAAALLLAQAGHMAAAGVMPVLLLDDLPSEFDAKHRGNVLEAGLKSGSQVWMTGTDLETMPTCGISAARVFHVEQGHIRATSGA